MKIDFLNIFGSLRLTTVRLNLVDNLIDFGALPRYDIVPPSSVTPARALDPST
jgi:hypothetical protein